MQEVSTAPGTTGPQIIFMPMENRRKKHYDTYRHKQSIVLGIVQVVIGSFCVIFNAVSVSMHIVHSSYDIGVIGHGFWGGILFVITGVFGIAAGKKKTKCKILAFMVLCIVSASCCILVLMFGVIGAYYSNSRWFRRMCPKMNNNESDDSDHFSGHYQYEECEGQDQVSAVITTMEALLAIAAVTEAIVAIFGSVLGCRSDVCCNSNSTMIAIPVSYIPNGGQIQCFNQTELGAFKFDPEVSGKGATDKGEATSSNGCQGRSISTAHAPRGLSVKQARGTDDTDFLINSE